MRQTGALEDALSTGDEAAAQQRASALVSRVDRAIASGRVPVALQDDLRAGARRLLSLVSGAVEPPAATPPAPPPPPPPDKKKDKKKKKDHDKDGEGEESSSATSPTETAPATDTTGTATGTTP